MLRRFCFSPPRIFRTLKSRQRPILGFAVAAVGTFFYARRVIHADSAEDDPTLIIYTLLSQPGSLTATPTSIHRSLDPDTKQEKSDEQTMVKMELGALAGHGTIDGDSGIRRFDSTSVPRLELVK
ncbi:hypothetical protein C0992_008219 [Termitomyces sp. T32_za158]|nr:hypothetical protein C0992_008219 [Termitomyces sp. T32_za158]